MERVLNGASDSASVSAFTARRFATPVPPMPAAASFEAAGSFYLARHRDHPLDTDLARNLCDLDHDGYVRVRFHQSLADLSLSRTAICRHHDRHQCWVDALLFTDHLDLRAKTCVGSSPQDC